MNTNQQKETPRLWTETDTNQQKDTPHSWTEKIKYH